MKLHPSTQRGFTLIEMIVALMIFSIVAVVALAALMRIISLNDKAQTAQSAITNLNFALESMSREMRVGSSYHCEEWNGSYTVSGSPKMDPQDCTFSSSSYGNKPVFVAFYSSKPGWNQKDSSKTIVCQLAEAYIIDSTSGTSAGPFTLYKAEQTYCDDVLGQTGSGSGGGKKFPILPLVSSNMTIQGFNLYVSPVDGTHPYQMATIRFTGFAGAREKEKTTFDVQTTIGERHQ